MSRFKKKEAQGVFVSIPTYCSDDYTVQYDRIAAHVGWLIQNGIRKGDGVIMVGGGLGEGYFLSEEEYRRVAETAVEAAKRRVPIMNALFELDGRAAARKAKAAADAGVDYIQVNPPHYTRPTDDEVFEYFRIINDAADIGITIYNTPWAASGFEITAPLMKRLVTLKNVEAIKWSSFDLSNFVGVLREYSGEVNFINNSSVINSVGFVVGMKGFVSHVGNFNPAVELELWRRMQKRDYVGCMEQYRKYHTWEQELSAAENITHEGLGEGTIVKAVLEAAGLDPGPPFPPQKRVSKDEVQRIRKAMLKAGVLANDRPAAPSR